MVALYSVITAGPLRRRFGRSEDRSISAAECDEREVARIIASLDRDHTNRFLHRGIHHADHAGRELLDARRGIVLFQLAPTISRVRSSSRRNDRA